MAGRSLTPGTLVSSTNKTECHDISAIFLKVALNTINQTKPSDRYIILKDDDMLSYSTKLILAFTY